MNLVTPGALESTPLLRHTYPQTHIHFSFAPGVPDLICPQPIQLNPLPSPAHGWPSITRPCHACPALLHCHTHTHTHQLIASTHMNMYTGFDVAVFWRKHQTKFLSLFSLFVCLCRFSDLVWTSCHHKAEGERAGCSCSSSTVAAGNSHCSWKLDRVPGPAVGPLQEGQSPRYEAGGRGLVLLSHLASSRIKDRGAFFEML